MGISGLIKHVVPPCLWGASSPALHFLCVQQSFASTMDPLK